MSNPQIPIPKVFISYSWTTLVHEEWVLSLASRLRENGVDVVLDKWDLKEGHDVYAFMESMVNSPDIGKVLVICDKGYEEKANDRRGGAGTETQIISAEIYSRAGQEKFIPIVSERGENGETYIPTLMKSRKYIDLSNEETFETGYEELLRNLHNRPQYRKPALGAVPAFLYEDAPTHFKTTNLLKQINDAAIRQPSRLKSLSNSFFDAVFEGLDQFQIERFEQGALYDELIVNHINDMLALRDDYVKFVEKQCSIQEQVDIDSFIDFFERITAYTQPPEHLTSYTKIQWDHYKFFIHELFIYSIMIFLEHTQFKAANELLSAEYFIKVRFHSELKHGDFRVFNFYLPSIEEVRRERLNLDRVSIFAEMMVQRATIKRYPKQKIVNTDLLMYYFSLMNDQQNYWFPRLYPYSSDQKVELLERLISMRHFFKVKDFFGVNSSKEMVGNMENIVGISHRGFPNSWDTIQPIGYHIDPKQICTLP
ncbi:SEFIR domain-containing protein [Paenibacillus nitricinens]|uniref:SEFIR domain-containing protein n=1 Tax=Paenibacillus nitricinens TaxID=3367691 RepID=UPI003F8416FC